MNPGLFDMLHDPCDHDIVAIAQRIDVALNRIFKKVIDQHRPLLRILDRCRHILHYRRIVIRNHHRTSAQHIRGPHQHRISHAIRSGHSLFDTGRHRALWLRNLQLFNQLPESLPVFREIDRLGRSPDDRHPGLL
jgi:hypothetical protein